MSQNRFVAIIKATWRYLLPAAAIIGVGWGAKLYFQQSTIPVEKKRAAATHEVVAKAIERLEDQVATHEGDDSPFPDSVDWTPVNIPCGDAVEPPAAVWEHPTWKRLGLAPEGPLVYQYRFRRQGKDGFELLARTDTDCDGIYQVRRAVGKTLWTGGLGSTVISTDNPGE